MSARVAPEQIGVARRPVLAHFWAPFWRTPAGPAVHSEYVIPCTGLCRLAIASMILYPLWALGAGLRLSCVTWPQTILVCIHSTLNGWLFAKFMRPRNHLCFVLFFVVLTSSFYVPVAYFERWDLQEAASLAVYVITYLSAFVFSENRLMGLCYIIWVNAFLTLLIFGCKTAIDVTNPYIRGLVPPAMSLTLEFAGFISFKFMYKRYGSGVSSDAFAFIAVVIVQSTEMIRMAALLSSSKAGSLENVILQACSNILAGLVSEILSRGAVFLAVMSSLWSCACKREVSISPELDVLLRARFTFSYTPVIAVLGYTFAGAPTHGVLWTSNLWPLLAAGIFAELLQDVVFVVLQRNRNESHWVAFQRLQKPNQHQCFVTKFSNIFMPEEDKVPAAPVMQNADAAGTRSGLFRRVLAKLSDERNLYCALIVFVNWLICAASLWIVFGRVGVTAPAMVCDS